MGKVKNKDHNETRFLQGEIRRLKKIIKSKDMEIRALKKHEHLYEISQDEEIETDSEDTMSIKKLIPCESDSCGKGFYIEMELLGRCYGTCSLCGYHKRLK